MSDTSQDSSDSSGRGRQARFLTLREFATMLNISSTQAYALVRSGDLPAIKVGGRGEWRVEVVMVQKWLETKRAETQQLIADHR